MEIKKVSIDKVEVWDKNLAVRATSRKNYERTRKQIVDLKIFKPVTAFEENGRCYILGGRLRYFVIKDLGHKEIDVSIVEARTDADKWKFVFADNDQSSIYLEEPLLESIYPHIEEFGKDLGQRCQSQPERSDVFVLPRICL